MLCTSAGAACAPAAMAQGNRPAAARSTPPGSGGAGLGGAPGAGGGSAAAGGSSSQSAGGDGLERSPFATPASVSQSASADGITVQTQTSTLLRRGLRFSGVIDASGAQEVVEIQRRGRATRWRWVASASAAISADGRFHAVWRADQAGILQFRAVALDSSLLGAAHARPGWAREARRLRGSHTGRAPRAARPAGASPPVAVIVYRPAFATLYGPGLYGRHTACGELLERSTIGVANRTLPCGTEVSIVYRGRALVVAVIDRGPYANGAGWDLTIAAADALGMHANAWIGAIALPRSATTATALRRRAPSGAR